MTPWLIVEDEPDIYATLVAMSELIGDGGVAFTDAEEAVTWIDEVDSGEAGHVEIKPHLALLDIRLPGELSGADVSARLRQSPTFANIAIVLITAYRLSEAEEDEIMQHSGADLLMYKPLPRIPEFQALVKPLLEREAVPSNKDQSNKS